MYSNKYNLSMYKYKNMWYNIRVPGGLPPVETYKIVTYMSGHMT